MRSQRRISEEINMADMDTRTRLLLGAAGVENLKNARVLLFGVGGVGASCAEALVRAGIGALTLVDGDAYCESNLNRQNFSAVDTIGQNKAAVARRELLRIRPSCDILAIEAFFTAQNTAGIEFSNYTYIIDAVDDTAAKLEIICRAKDCGVPVISSMGAGNKLDPTRFSVSDIYETSVCPLAKIMRKLCREAGISKLRVVWSDEPPRPLIREAGAVEPGKKTVGSISFVPSACGLVIAGEVIRQIAGVTL